MNTQPDSQAIRELAYQLWQSRSEDSGCAEDDWCQAEQLLLGREISANSPVEQAIDESGRQTFPASDSPSTHSPDEPPANADTKWAESRLIEARAARPR